MICVCLVERNVSGWGHDLIGVKPGISLEIP
jgi:hypothetical protein